MAINLFPRHCVLNRGFWCILAAVFLWGSASLNGQTAPNAGSIQQQNERALKKTLPPAERPEEQPSKTPAKASKGPLVTVKSFHFVGNSLLSSQDLRPVVAKFTGHPMDFSDLQMAANAVGAAYRKAGWIVRSYLPAQDIKGGVVTIRIVEAVFGGVKVDGPKDARVNPDRLKAIFKSHLAVGEPLNANAIDRALFIANDLPGVVVSGNLRAGEKARETELVATYAKEPLVSGEVTVDNAGLRATGQAEASAHLNVNSPFGHSNLITADTTIAQGSDYLRLAAVTPVGLNGWHLGVNGSYLHYHLITNAFSSLDVHGTAESAGIDATYPIVRTRRANLYFRASADHKWFDNRAEGKITTRYSDNILSLGLAGNRFDNFAGGGVTSASVTLVGGRLDLGGSPNETFDAATTRTNGDYALLRGSISRNQSLSRNVSVYLGVSGQISDKNLDSSEKIYLGGLNGVRAYPTDEGGGSEGAIANLELSRKLPAGLSASAFVDYGYVAINHNDNFPGGAANNTYSLKGAGLALGWHGPKGTDVSVSWAHRLGHNPNPSPTGTDQDGSLVMNRIWVSAHLTF